MAAALIDWDGFFRWLRRALRSGKYSQWQQVSANTTSANWLGSQAMVTFNYNQDNERHYGVVRSLSDLESGRRIEGHWIEILPAGSELMIRLDPQDPLNYVVLNDDNPDWPWEIAE